MFQRLKRLILLSKKDPQAVEMLLEEKIQALPDDDTKAVFLGAGTAAEFKEQQKEDNGLKGIFGL